MNRFFVAFAALGLIAAPGAASAAKPAAKLAGWAHTVSVTPAGGYLVGNPKAPVKVIEFFSLTCGHCRDFAVTGYPALEKGYITSGKVSIELRNFVLNPFDMAASLLMRCTTPAGAARLFHAAYDDFDVLFAGAQRLDKASADKVMAAPLDKRPLLLAHASGIDRWFAGKGVAQAQAAKCLADPVAQRRLADMREAATRQFSIQGTPGFVVNGTPVDGNDWASLEAAIKAALR